MGEGRGSFIRTDLGGFGKHLSERIWGAGGIPFFLYYAYARERGIWGTGRNGEGKGGRRMEGCTHTLDDDVESVSQSVSQLDLS